MEQKHQETTRLFIASWAEFNSGNTIKPPILFRENEVAKAHALIIATGCARTETIRFEEAL